MKTRQRLKENEILNVLSYRQQLFGQKVEYEVPDNWWHNKDYYNVPLDTFMRILKKALSHGTTTDDHGTASSATENPKREFGRGGFVVLRATQKPECGP
jgi:bleomycin hydrolase